MRGWRLRPTRYPPATSSTRSAGILQERLRMTAMRCCSRDGNVGAGEGTVTFGDCVEPRTVGEFDVSAVGGWRPSYRMNGPPSDGIHQA